MAKIEPEFIKRNPKLNRLSIDPVESHGKRVSDTEETQTGRHRGYLSRRLKSPIAAPPTP
jgi:alkyl hydroperoxide reductase subunit AhpC